MKRLMSSLCSSSLHQLAFNSERERLEAALEQERALAGCDGADEMSYDILLLMLPAMSTAAASSMHHFMRDYQQAHHSSLTFLMLGQGNSTASCALQPVISKVSTRTLHTRVLHPHKHCVNSISSLPHCSGGSEGNDSRRDAVEVGGGGQGAGRAAAARRSYSGERRLEIKVAAAAGRQRAGGWRAFTFVRYYISILKHAICCIFACFVCSTLTRRSCCYSLSRRRERNRSWTGW